jgi:hypothetical protein
MLCRRVLLAALVIQASTPDFLDLTLLSRSLPPGPFFAVSNLALGREAGSTLTALLFQGILPPSDAAPTGEEDEEAPPAALGELFWPPLAICLCWNLGHRARPRVESVVQRVARIVACASILPANDPGGAGGLARSRLLCRLLC